MDKRFEQIYYSDDGYWRGKSAIEKLAKASGSTKEEAGRWLLKQPLHCIRFTFPLQSTFQGPNASMSLFAKPNDIHQSDLLSLPQDKFKKKTYKYALNIVDVASRYKESYQLATKNSKEVAQAFQWIYENTPLTYPKTLIVDDGKEFYGDVTKLMEKHDLMIQHGDPSQHRLQGIVERFNRTLADRLFSYQYHKELEDPSKSNREWVSRLQNVFQELVKTVKRRRKLSGNDLLRLVIQNEELTNAISTKFNKVQDFKLGDLENVINILEYRAIRIEKCKMVVQSVRIPAGKGRLYLTKDTVQERTVALRLRTTIPYVWLEL